MSKLFKFSLDVLVKAENLEQAEEWAKEEFGFDIFECHILTTELEDNHFNQEIDIDLT